MNIVFIGQSDPCGDFVEFEKQLSNFLETLHFELQVTAHSPVLLLQLFSRSVPFSSSILYLSVPNATLASFEMRRVARFY